MQFNKYIHIYIRTYIHTLFAILKEVLFLRQVQEFMEPSMRVGAVNVFEDNEGAIKLATNKHASRRTKHTYIVRLLD